MNAQTIHTCKKCGFATDAPPDDSGDLRAYAKRVGCPSSRGPHCPVPRNVSVCPALLPGIGESEMKNRPTPTPTSDTGLPSMLDESENLWASCSRPRDIAERMQTYEEGKMLCGDCGEYKWPASFPPGFKRCRKCIDAHQKPRKNTAGRR